VAPIPVFATFVAKSLVTVCRGFHPTAQYPFCCVEACGRQIAALLRFRERKKLIVACLETTPAPLVTSCDFCSKPCDRLADSTTLCHWEAGTIAAYTRDAVIFELTAFRRAALAEELVTPPVTTDIQTR
jgi:hypothetical protein